VTVVSVSVCAVHTGGKHDGILTNRTNPHDPPLAKQLNKRRLFLSRT